MRVARGLVEEEILHDHALHRREPRGNVLRVRIGLHDVFTLDVEALERAIQGRIDHVGDAQAGLGLQRHLPLGLKRLAHRGIGNVPVTGEFVRERSHIARALHVVLAAQRTDADALLSHVAGGHREVGHAHHHRGALAVLGDAQPVVDRRVSAGRVEPRGGAQIRRRNSGDRVRALPANSFPARRTCATVRRLPARSALSRTLHRPALR